MLNPVKSPLIRPLRILGSLVVFSLLVTITACSANKEGLPVSPTTSYYEGPFSEIPVTQNWQYNGAQGSYTVTLKLSKYRMIDEVKAEDHPAKKGFLAAEVCPNIENSGVLAGVITIKMQENSMPFAPKVDFGVTTKNQYQSKIAPKIALATGEKSICRAFDIVSFKSLEIESVKQLSAGESVSYPIYLIFAPYKESSIEKANPEIKELDKFSFNFLPVNSSSGKYESSGEALSLRHIIESGK